MIPLVRVQNCGTNMKSKKYIREPRCTLLLDVWTFVPFGSTAKGELTTASLINIFRRRSITRSLLGQGKKSSTKGPHD